MTSLSLTPVLLDDSELLRLSSTPRTRLFPILNRASAFAPLILVCCVLPAFQLLATRALDDEVSAWGLRSLDVANANSIGELLAPGSNEQGQPLIFQPPLAAWLNGILVWILGPSQPFVQSIMPLAATAIAIWLTTRLARRFGGANTALISALLMCSHPQILEMAISPSNGPIGFSLMLVSIFGFQRHLEGKSAHVSKSLVISGITWGLSLLAIGPIAFTVPLLFALHSMYQRTSVLPETVSRSFLARLTRGWPVLRSTLILVGIGLFIGGWWEVMMLYQYGLSFWCSWWTSLPGNCLAPDSGEWPCDLQRLFQPSWREWLNQQLLLIGWSIVGLERSWNEWCRPTSELARRRFQLLIFWWMIAFVGRIVAEIAGTYFVVNTFVWNLMLLAPMVLFAALGFETLIERGVSRRGEFLLVVVLVSLTSYRITSSWLAAGIGGALAATVLICGPRLTASMGRNENGWSERGWQSLLRITVYWSLIACLSMGFVRPDSSPMDEDRLSNLRDRLNGIPEVRRISLIGTGDSVPITLRYVLRCRWPHAELVTSEGWDLGLTNAMNEESKAPRSRFLLLEWSRRDIRFSANAGQEWQIKSIGEPMRFQGRRLSFVLIAPQS